MKKGDIGILILISLAAAGLFFSGIFLSKIKDERDTIEVICDGRRIAEYSLLEDGEYEIQTELGVNTLSIENGSARIISADCPGGDCMKMKLDKKGGSIICLPHKLVIKAEEKDPEGVDAVAR